MKFYTPIKISLIILMVKVMSHQKKTTRAKINDFKSWEGGGVGFYVKKAIFIANREKLDDLESSGMKRIFFTQKNNCTSQFLRSQFF